MEDISLPEDGENGGCCAFLVPADAPALALKPGATWIGRGSFPASPAAQKACSRRQARVVCGDGGLTIECHGLRPLYFARCQSLNFCAEPRDRGLFSGLLSSGRSPFVAVQETGWAGLRKLSRGESVVLSDGDLFHLAHSQCLLKVVVVGSPEVPISDAIRSHGPGAQEQVCSGVSGRTDCLDASDSRRPTQCPREGASSSAASESSAADFRKDMESVVASMTGYEGLEKMKLIKLINKTGAAFTGKWTARNTHLVCWKFSGPKYDMAKRSGKTILINHRWFEDCLSGNCKLPEHSYTLQSGEEVGPLLWNDSADDPSVRKKEGLDLKGKNVVDLTDEAEPSQPSVTTLLPQVQGIDEAGPSAVHEVDIARYRSRRRQRDNTVSRQQRSIEQSLGRLSLSPVDSASGKRPLHPTGVPEHRTKFRRLAKRSAADDRAGLEQSRGGASFVGAAVPEAVIDLTTPPAARPDASEATFQQQPRTIIGSPDYRTRIAATRDSPELGSNLEVPDHRIPIGGATGVVKLGYTDLNIASPLVEPAGGTLRHAGKGSPEAEIVCVICYAENRAENRGVLSCGHEFCFICIHKWALEAKHRDPLCPLCKAPFDKITKRSHNTPNGVSCQDEDITVGVIPTSASFPPAVTERFCITCGSTDSPDLICVCRGCSQRAIHIFCIDPPGHVNDDWFCPRCLPRRHREQWQRLLPGNAEYPGNSSRSNLLGGRAMRSINLDEVEIRRTPRASAAIPGPSRPSSRSMQPRQQSISNFVFRR